MKKRILKKTLMLFAFMGLAVFQMNGQETFSTGLNGWDVAYGATGPVTHNATEGIRGDGALELARTGNNSNFGLGTSAGIDADTNKYIKIRFKNETLAAYQLKVEKLPSTVSIMVDLIKRLFYLNPKLFIVNSKLDIKKAIIKQKLKNKF